MPLSRLPARGLQFSSTKESAMDNVKTTLPDDPGQVVDKVRERYGRIATGESSGWCGASSAAATQVGYQSADLERLPEGANLGLGCGAPIDFLDLMPGETVLDLGSGAGRVIGVDLTTAGSRRSRSTMHPWTPSPATASSTSCPTSRSSSVRSPDTPFRPTCRIV